MVNDEYRNQNDEEEPKSLEHLRHSDFVINSSFGNSSFVILQ
jgi:hypothetical protein